MSVPAIEQNSASYERMLPHVARSLRLDPEIGLGLARQLAAFAWYNHTGRFADGALENEVLNLGRFRAIPKKAQSAKRRILHLATTIYAVGGHGRFLKRWIALDTSSVHDLILTRQWESEVPTWLTNSVRESGGRTIQLSATVDMLAAAVQTRALAEDADAVILHQHFDDFVPVLAFATPGGPPVALLNHADHLFWVGSSVADVVINIRAAGAALAPRRFAARNFILPIPLDHVAASAQARDVARRALGVRDDCLMLLTVGSGFKFEATAKHDFFATASAILSRYPNAELYAVGPSGTSRHPHIHLLGEIASVDLFYAAADIFLESYPFGSMTATLEAAQARTAVVLSHSPLADVLVTNTPALDAHVSHAASEAAYIEEVARLIEEPTRREKLADDLKTSIARHHEPESFRLQLGALYALLATIEHTSRPLPVTRCELTASDLAIAEWGRSTWRPSEGSAQLVGPDLLLNIARVKRRFAQRALVASVREFGLRATFKVGLQVLERRLGVQRRS